MARIDSQSEAYRPSTTMSEGARERECHMRRRREGEALPARVQVTVASVTVAA
jgi:hypothetical protein